MHSEGGITAHKGCMVICRTWELQDQGLAGTEGACKSLTPEGAISIGRGLRPPASFQDRRLLNADIKLSYINRELPIFVYVGTFGHRSFFPRAYFDKSGFILPFCDMVVWHFLAFLYTRFGIFSQIKPGNPV